MSTKPPRFKPFVSIQCFVAVSGCVRPGELQEKLTTQALGGPQLWVTKLERSVLRVCVMGQNILSPRKKGRVIFINCGRVTGSLALESGAGSKQHLYLIGS